MPSIERPLSGDVLAFDLLEEARQGSDAGTLARSGRIARTLLKEGPLRVTLVVLAAGGSVPEHQTEGPVTVQPVRGSIRLTVRGDSWDLGPGHMLAIGPGVPHSVEALDGATFLLTVAHPPAA